MKDASDPCCERPVCSPDLATPTPAETQTPAPGSTVTPPFGSTANPPLGVSTPWPTPIPKGQCCAFTFAMHIWGFMYPLLEILVPLLVKGSSDCKGIATQLLIFCCVCVCCMYVIEPWHFEPLFSYSHFAFAYSNNNKCVCVCVFFF